MPQPDLLHKLNSLKVRMLCRGHAVVALLFETRKQGRSLFFSSTFENDSEQEGEANLRTCFTAPVAAALEAASHLILTIISSHQLSKCPNSRNYFFV